MASLPALSLQGGLAHLSEADHQVLRSRAAKLAGWRPPAPDPTTREDVAVFGLGDELWGIGLRWIREVVPPVAVTAIPGAPDHVQGVFMHRGRVLAMVDLQRYLSIPGDAAPARCVLVLATAEMEFGIETSQLHGYRSVTVAELSPHVGSAAGDRNAGHAPLLGVTSDRLAVLDGAALLAMPGFGHATGD